MDYIHNDLLKVSVIIDKDIDAVSFLKTRLDIKDKIYSYKLLDKGKQWKLEWLISKIAKYNTISVEDMIIAVDIALPVGTVLTAFGQPPLELMLKLYEPLINKLATIQVKAWRLEYDDAAQICRLVICKLYNKGYYINKPLIVRAYRNELYNMLNKELTQIEAQTESELFKDDLDVIELIPDESLSEEFDNNEDILYKRQLVINQIGQRQYDDYLRQFTNNNISNATRNRLLKLSRKLGGKK